MHYVDEGTGEAGTFLLLHGEPTWSYLYRGLIPVLTVAGYRTIAPDMIGFGKSDKVIDLEWYTLDHHVNTLKTVVTHLDRLFILNTWLHHDGYDYTQALRAWNVRSQGVDFRKFAAHIPGATFDTVEGAGHFVQETGARLAELMLRRISEE